METELNKWQKVLAPQSLRDRIAKRLKTAVENYSERVSTFGRKNHYFCITTPNIRSMAKVFKVTPKRVKRINGLVLTPDMSVVVTTQHHSNSPFNNGAKELQEMYMRLYGFDYKKACCTQADFDWEVLG